MAYWIGATGRQAAADAVATLLEGGNLKIFSDAQQDPDAADPANLLVTIPIGAGAFNAATDDGSVATASLASAISNAATAGGTAASFIAEDSGGNNIISGTVGQGSGDLSLDDTTIVNGGTVQVNTWTITNDDGQP